MNLCDTCKKRDKVIGYCEDKEFFALQEGVDVDEDLEVCENYEPEEKDELA